MVDYNEWRACVSEEDAPAYVKSASFPEAALQPSRRSFFADQVAGELPCNSREETWASARYFAKHASDECYSRIRADVEYNLQKAAEMFGISEDVAKVLTHSVEVKTASDADYGWVREGVRKYPMFDAHGVKLAAAYFEDNKFKYPFPMRNEIAKNILRKAAEFSVEVPDGIRKTAGHGVARPDNVINELAIRAELCHDPDTGIALAKMAEYVAEHGAEALAGATEKIAELVEDTDVIESWRSRYGKDMSAPEDFLFDMDVKQAEAIVNDVVEIGGDALSLSKLAELPDEVFDNVLGEGFAASVKEAGAIDPRKLGEALAAKSIEDLNELSHALKRL
jgi:hypothetical protein